MTELMQAMTIKDLDNVIEQNKELLDKLNTESGLLSAVDTNFPNENAQKHLGLRMAFLINNNLITPKDFADIVEILQIKKRGQRLDVMNEQVKLISLKIEMLDWAGNVI